MIRAWGKDGQTHIMAGGGSWCGAETFTNEDPPAFFPTDVEISGLVCQQCAEMEIAYQHRGLGLADVLLVGFVAVVVGVAVVVRMLFG